MPPNYLKRQISPLIKSNDWLTGETQLSDHEEIDSDACAIRKGMISITPIYYDLTRYDVMADLTERIKRQF
jgi:5'-nucleotidase